jgi:sulfocyanin
VRTAIVTGSSRAGSRWHLALVPVLALACGARTHAHPTSAPVAAAAAGASRSPVDSTGLAVDPRARTVTLRLQAAMTDDNGSLNFDGGSHGSRVLSVPLGWRVRIILVNRDREFHHSAIVVHAAMQVPTELRTPAFAAARSTHAEQGTGPGGRDSLSFVADRAGRYLIACGVPGHAQAGMFIRLAVSATAARPAYRREAAPAR